MINDFDFEHICERKRSRCKEEVRPLRLLDNRLGNNRAPYPASKLSKAVHSNGHPGFIRLIANIKPGFRISTQQPIRSF